MKKKTKKKLGKKYKKFQGIGNKIFFYIMAFIFGFLPSTGIVLIALLNADLIRDTFPNLNPHFYLISVVVYTFLSISIFFLSNPKATLFRKNFAASSIINFILFFLMNRID